MLIENILTQLDWFHGKFQMAHTAADVDKDSPYAAEGNHNWKHILVL